MDLSKDLVTPHEVQCKYSLMMNTLSLDYVCLHLTNEPNRFAFQKSKTCKVRHAILKLPVSLSLPQHFSVVGIPAQPGVVKHQESYFTYLIPEREIVQKMKKFYRKMLAILLLP